VIGSAKVKPFFTPATISLKTFKQCYKEISLLLIGAANVKQILNSATNI